MTPERWHEITEIFHAALARDATQRDAFLDTACTHDPSLRAEVDTLVRAHGDAGNFGDTPLSAIPGVDRHLAPGTMLEAFRIESLLGAGGMGEVYRAVDTELRRDVAIKILPDSLADDRDRLARLEKEARVLAALNHPNIAAIYGTVATPAQGPGRRAGRALVLELVEGETLAARLHRGGAGGSGRGLPIAEALAIARQIGEALEAAHDKGIVHRDLKPANIAVARDGAVKVLDFGLAKSFSSVATDALPSSIGVSQTGEGVLLGTAAYMSPEQARGASVDKRTDIWAFGCVLYEMLTGRLAFPGATITDTLAAVIEREPDWSALPAGTPSDVRRLLDRTLRKTPTERLRDIGDARHDLVSPSAATLPSPLPLHAGRGWAYLAGGVLAALAAVLVMRAWPIAQPAGSSTAASPEFRQLTFRRGYIPAARFAADGRTILYSAVWDGGSPEVFAGSLDGPESRSLGWPSGVLLSVSRTNEVALSLGCRTDPQFQLLGCGYGTLATTPLAGGAPRAVATGVLHADFGTGGTVAVVRLSAGSARLEFPMGHVVLEAGRIVFPRVDARGVRIVASTQQSDTDPASLILIDRDGTTRTLSTGWNTISGIAWAPATDEIWFSAMRDQVMSLRAVTVQGRERQVLELPTQVRLFDISQDGAILFATAKPVNVTMIKAPDDEREHAYSWFDQGWAVGLSDDGRLMLFNERGRAVQGQSTMYLRPTDGTSPAVRLGEGDALALSPDARSVLAVRMSPSGQQLVVVPVGAGDPTILPRGAIDRYQQSYGAFFPDGRRVMFHGHRSGEGLRVFVQDLPNGEPRAITPDLAYNSSGGAVSPDGQWVFATINSPEGYRHMLCPVAGGEPRRIFGLRPDQSPLQWSLDGSEVFAREWIPFDQRLETEVVRMSLRTGRQTAWRTIRAADTAGAGFPRGVILSRDARAYTYHYQQSLEELYVATGLK